MTAQGNAFAGATAGADDVSYMFFNPAALGWVDKVEVARGRRRWRPKLRARRTPSGSTVLGTPISGSTTTTTSARTPSVPPSTPRCRCRRACAGLGVNVPFGLETNYSRDLGRPLPRGDPS